MKLSIIMCAYNERRTILDALNQAHAVELGPGWEKEIIVVDNCSTDGTREMLQKVDLPDTRVMFHQRNQGKAGSLKTGLAEASGDYFVIFDADLEYEASDLPRMAAQVVPGETVAVYGSRTLGGRKIYKYAKNYWGVRFLSALTNLLYGSNLSDVAVGLKMARVDVARALNLTHTAGFDLEFELTFKLIKNGHKIVEIPTAYHPRTVAEGKKIKAFRTGFSTLWLMIKIRLWG
jgi:glycosyltransferase involved in cell wall biosynthesis